MSKKISTNKVDEKKVDEHIKSFTLEYPNYDSQMVSDYIQLMDDCNLKEQDLFAQKLGY